MALTPQVGITSSTTGVKKTVPYTIAARNEAYANAVPQDFGDRSKGLPPNIVGAVAQNAHPHKDGGV